MLSFIDSIFESMLITAENERLMITGLVCAVIVAAIFRIILALAYQGQIAMVYLTAKQLDSKDEIGNLRMGAFARVAKEYAVLGERGIGKIDARTIVERDLLKFGLLFWNYKSIEGFVTSLDNAVLFVGILFTVVSQSKETFAVVTVAAFLTVKLFAAIFDFSLAREKYVTNTSFLLDREIGRFYITDNATAVNALAAGVRDALALQSEALRESIAKLGDSLTGVVKTSMTAMTQSVESTMKSITSYSDTLDAPVKSWKSGLEAADAAQAKINNSLGLLNNAINNFSTVSGVLGSSLQDYKDELNVNAKHVEKQIALIAESVEALKGITDNISARDGAFVENIAYMKDNQRVLEQSIQQYEVTLKGLTAQMGDGLGKIVDFHVHEAYNTLNEGLQQHMRVMAASNNELLVRLQDLFNQMREQSRSETNAILSVKQQMDIHFEKLNSAAVKPEA